MRCAEYEAMEERLYNWFINKRHHNAPITSEIIQEKAKLLCAEIYGPNVEFKASNGWLNNFRSRYGIKFLQISGEKLSNDTSAVKPFIEELHAKMAEMNITYSQVYNADETALFWRKLPDKTLALHTEKSAPGRKIGKERVTILVCCNATGEHKLKLLMIGKAKNPRAFKKENLPLEYANSKNAWMTEVIFKNWFEKSFVKQVKSYLKENNLSNRALLLVDNATCHPKSLADMNNEICVMFFPPNCTALMQPMDQNAIRILKMNYRKSFLSTILSSSENLMEALKTFSLKDVVFLICNAWDKTNENVLKKCFNKILYDEEWDSDDEVPLARLRRSDCDEVIDLLVDLAPDVYNSVEINNWLNDEVDITDDDVEGDEVESFSEEHATNVPKTQHSQAISALNSCIKYCEEQEFPAGDILKLISIRDIAYKKQNETKLHQTKISNYFCNN